MAFSAKPSLGRATTRPSLQVCSAKFRPQSRIGKQPVVIPSTCKYTLENNFFTVTVRLLLSEPAGPCSPSRGHWHECYQ